MDASHTHRHTEVAHKDTCTHVSHEYNETAIEKNSHRPPARRRPYPPHRRVLQTPSLWVQIAARPPQRHRSLHAGTTGVRVPHSEPGANKLLVEPGGLARVVRVATVGSVRGHPFGVAPASRGNELVVFLRSIHTNFFVLA